MTRPPRRRAARELVVLLDDAGRPVGTAPKSTVHGPDTHLHRAFSCYLFDDAGRLLLTRRALTKGTFPGLWTNSVCGHPGPGEGDTAAARRRTRQELRLHVTELKVALPDFRYRATSGGIVENEVCPVYLGRVHDRTDPEPDPSEVAGWAWADWPEVLLRVGRAPAGFSPWFVLQLPLLQRAGAVERFLRRDAPSRPRQPMRLVTASGPTADRGRAAQAGFRVEDPPGPAEGTPPGSPEEGDGASRCTGPGPGTVVG